MRRKFKEAGESRAGNVHPGQGRPASVPGRLLRVLQQDHSAILVDRSNTDALHVDEFIDVVEGTVRFPVRDDRLRLALSDTLEVLGNFLGAGRVDIQRSYPLICCW